MERSPSEVCSQGSADSTSDLSGPVYVANGKSRSMTTPTAYSQSTGRPLGDGAMSATSPLRQLMLGESISSAAGFPVRIFPTPESEPDSTGNEADCGLSSRESLAWFDHDSLLWRTSQRSLFEEWSEFSETWPQTGMTRNGRCYRLTPLVRNISDVGFSLSPLIVWPTPVRSEGAQWSSLESFENSDYEHIRLTSAVRMKPEIFSTEYREPICGALNPVWVEWLMGFPAGYTDLEDLATPSCLKSQSSSDAD